MKEAASVGQKGEEMGNEGELETGREESKLDQGQKGEMGTMQHKCMREDEIWHYKFLL